MRCLSSPELPALGGYGGDKFGHAGGRCTSFSLGELSGFCWPVMNAGSW